MDGGLEVLKVDSNASPVKTADCRRVFSLAVDRNCDGNVRLVCCFYDAGNSSLKESVCLCTCVHVPGYCDDHSTLSLHAIST